MAGSVKLTSVETEQPPIGTLKDFYVMALPPGQLVGSGTYATVNVRRIWDGKSWLDLNSADATALLNQLIHGKG